MNLPKQNSTPPASGVSQRFVQGACRRAHRPMPAAQRGVVLVIALILVVVIGVSSAVAIRTSLFGDIISQNMRAQNLAFQAAEIALRYCEEQALEPGAPGVTVIPSGIGNEWTVESNWTNSANNVPAEFVGSDLNYPTAPQCLIRELTYEDAFGAMTKDPTKFSIIDANPELVEYMVFYRITARGFSPEFQRDGNGLPIAGAQASVQSMTRGFRTRGS